MAEFTCSLEFGQPREIVFALLTDLERAHHWMKGLDSIVQTTDGEFGVGTRFDETRTMFGKSCTEHFEVVGFEPPRSVDFAVPSKGVDYAFRYVFEPTMDAGCTVTLIGEAKPRGVFVKVMMGIMGMGMMKKACLRDMESARDFLDSGGADDAVMEIEGAAG